ncbi:ScyD/ScyE family protein [Actinotalea sp. AC32]|nr:ScyD/ScyE family protein [Actinotalea sp. AC32]
MSSRTVRYLAGAGSLSLVAGLLVGGSAQAQDGPTVVASGLNSPRQLAFSPGGTLYVAESGTNGDEGCQQHPEFGLTCVGLTGSVARVGMDGTVDRVVTGLPSHGNDAESIGPSDLVLTGNHTFALTIGIAGTPEFRAGYGASGALLGTVVTGDLRAHKGAGSVEVVFDALAYEAAANPDGTDVDSNAVGIARSGDGWVLADAGANAVVSTRWGGSTVAVLDPVPTTVPGPFDGFPPVGFPADAVPTDVVRGPDGAWYVSQLVGFPFEEGSSTIWRGAPGGALEPWATGLTNVTSIAFADDGTLYAVQIADAGILTGPVGSVVRVVPGGADHETVAAGLFAPYGIAIRGSSAYVTTGSLLAGGGQVVRVDLSHPAP